tara:strand:+ start:349 stop:795 length:447 start_codon:yes stop_codon:yes gene_type:complete
MMTRKNRRLIFLLAGFSALTIAAVLVLSAFEESLVFFYSPTDVIAQELRSDVPIRLGGLVEDGSVSRASDGLTTTFQVTDMREVISVTYTGLLPDLFREGQGVVVEGHLGTDGVFVANEVLAKHDETYMPPEVADALKKSGQWKGTVP